MQPVRRSFLAALLCLAVVRPAAADVRLPSIFADHMVVQREQPVPVWGWAKAGEQVQAALAGQTKTATADADGRWKLTFDALPAGGPHELVVQGGNRLAIRDVLVGEVWLCSGQSNMAMTVNRALNYEEEQKAATNPQIRQFKVASTYAADPQEDCKGDWSICSAETVGGFSATAYFFAREIARVLQLPVGIVNSSVGGTPIDSWISESAQHDSAELRDLFAKVEASRQAFNAEEAKARYEQQLAKWRENAKAARAAGQQPPRAPQDPVAQFERKANLGGLFNGMIAPIIGYGFRGALWYQGEANSTPDKAAYYRHQLPLLVTDWRTRHGSGDFPFAWVQLPNFKGAGRNWPMVREAMLQATRLPHTGTAVTIDVGETGDIHPKNKQEVGRRLALWALATVYGKSGITLPPVVAGTKVENGTFIVTLQPADASLVQEAGQPDLRIAAIAGADRQWKPATVGVLSGGRLSFRSAEVPEPVAVRYLWSNDPRGGLIRTADGLPISPFRTDDWDAVTPFDQ